MEEIQPGRSQETGDRRQETGVRRQETGVRRQEPPVKFAALIFSPDETRCRLTAQGCVSLGKYFTGQAGAPSEMRPVKWKRLNRINCADLRYFTGQAGDRRQESGDSLRPHSGLRPKGETVVGTSLFSHSGESRNPVNAWIRIIPTNHTPDRIEDRNNK